MGVKGEVGKQLEMMVVDDVGMVQMMSWRWAKDVLFMRKMGLGGHLGGQFRWTFEKV